MRNKLFLPLFLALFALACNNDDKDVFDPAQWVGVYKGSWKNLNNGSTGPATVIITADLVQKTSIVTIDFDGNYLGQMDPPAAIMPGSYDDEGAHLVGTDAFFGNYDLTVKKDGTAGGTFTNLVGGMIPKMIYNCKLDGQNLDATYTVEFPTARLPTARPT